MNLFRLRHAVRTAIWLVPLLCLFAFLALAIVTLAIDRASDYKLIGQNLLGSPTAVQQILSTAASSLLSLATVVLSLTLVAVQLAMGQFSPRIVRALLEDRRSQLGMGLFIGTFAYTMAVLRDVDDQSRQMPGLSVLVSYVLIVASVAGLVLFVHYAAQSIRVSGLIDLVGDTTRQELDRLYPRRSADAPARDELNVIAATESGNVIRLDEGGLVMPCPTTMTCSLPHATARACSLASSAAPMGWACGWRTHADNTTFPQAATTRLSFTSGYRLSETRPASPT